ncbi:hypothetical protein K469DRAFT_292828 [Zopfia rhizophila CBS 207.26]|uniref:Secreted protein n=1 Tax=Zopfia rhizophila CBS 207.26 TaxID=1314779 RepID=A0A6A6DQ24_9PEZI|nr:hypothetical protein K469DRAFT_292828 [Zopfia rhizophila CBS 207.26]
MLLLRTTLHSLCKVVVLDSLALLLVSRQKSHFRTQSPHLPFPHETQLLPYHPPLPDSMPIHTLWRLRPAAEISLRPPFHIRYYIHLSVSLSVSDSLGFHSSCIIYPRWLE